MKLTSVITTLRGVRCVKFKAVIPASKKLGRYRHQKTWSFETCAPEFTTTEMRSSVEKEAARWEAKVLQKYEEKKKVEAAVKSAEVPELIGVEDEEL